MPIDASKQGAGGFFRKAARVATGHAAGYGVGLAVSPILARLYGPEPFGLFALFVLAVSSLAVAATLRFDQAVPLAKSARSAAAVTQLAAFAMAATAALVVVLALPIEQAIANFGGGHLPDLWWAAVAAAVVCLSVYQLTAAWLLRNGDYRGLAGMRLVFAVTMAATQLAIPLCGGSIWLGLLIGQAVGFAAGTLYGTRRIATDVPRLVRLSTSICRRFGWRYRQFALFGVPAALVSNIGIHIPALILAACFGLEVAGMFALAQRVFTTPLTLLTHSFSRVFLAEAAGQQTAGELALLFRSTLRGGAVLATVPIATVAVLAPWGFGLVFGSEWSAAGWICTVLAPMALAMSLSQCVNPVYDLVGRQDRRLGRELLCTSLTVGGLLAGWLAGWPAIGAILLGSAGGTIGYLLLVVFAARYVAEFRPHSAVAPRAKRLAA